MQEILLKRLHKRRHLTYGPALVASSDPASATSGSIPTGGAAAAAGGGGSSDPRGTLFIDDLHSPEPDSAGRINLHEVGG